MLSSATKHGVVVPSDVDPVTVTVAGVNRQIRPRALFFKGAGDVSITDDEGTTVVYTVVAGQILDIRPRMVNSTATTVAAGSIIGWW